MLTASSTGNASVSLLHRHRFVPPCSLLIALFTIAACSSSDSPTAPEGRPQFNISDAVHEGGTPGFYFLPPLVAHATFSGTFDASIGTLDPRIALCDVTNGPDANCGAPGGTPPVALFTTTSTPAITFDSTTNYRVNWDTKAGGVLAGHTYRIHVTAGASGASRELGFADVLLTSSPGQAGNSQGGDLIVLNAGRTLPIHFRIETGIPGSLTLSAQASTVGPGATAPISATVVDLHGAPLAGAAVAWTVTTAPATGVADAAQPLNPTNGQTDATGTTASMFKAGGTPGTATVRAASAGLSALLSLSVTSGTAAAIAANSAITQSAPAGTTVAAPPAVIVRDAAGNPVAGVSVAFAVTSGGGTVIPAAPVTTDARGIAAVTSWALGPTAETNTLTATAAGNGIAGNPVTFTATTRGSLTVTTTTTGSAQSGFYFASFSGPGVDGFRQVGTNGSATFSALPVGSYTVTLSDVPVNCAVTGANSQLVSVAGGGATVAFTVNCSPTAGGEISGRGQIGTGAPAPGNNVVTFDFDVRADLTGRFTGTDFADLHGTTPASLTTDVATDPETRITAYRSSSSACSDPNVGVEFDAIGREDTGNLVSYTAYLCDVDGAAASGGDFFKVFVPSENFTVSGTVTSGDIVKK